jgi:hypothetical protein
MPQPQAGTGNGSARQPPIEVEAAQPQPWLEDLRLHRGDIAQRQTTLPKIWQTMIWNRYVLRPSLSNLPLTDPYPLRSAKPDWPSSVNRVEAAATQARPKTMKLKSSAIAKQKYAPHCSLRSSLPKPPIAWVA